MPIYEYQCDACGKRFEQIQKFADAPVDVCPQCGKGPVQRLMSAPAFQFKGSGWYITDYAKKGSGDVGSAGDNAGKTDKADKTDKTDTAGKKDSTTSDKTDAKPAAADTKPSTSATPAKE